MPIYGIEPSDKSYVSVNPGPGIIPCGSLCGYELWGGGYEGQG